MWNRISASFSALGAAYAAATWTRPLWSAVLMVATALTVLVLGSGSAARASTTCDAYASPQGSDSGSGSYQHPFRTPQELVDALQAGQTGCLMSGTYAGDVRIATARLTLTAAPGQSPTIVGGFKVVEGADYVTVAGLTLDGENPTRLPSPMIDANHVTFSGDNVTNNHTGICFALGNATWGWATGTLITHSRIHDCGEISPGDNYQHGFYIGAATDTTIEWNLIYANAARGIQLYPDAQYTTIDHNIIDDNGEGIMVSGEGGHASSHTNIYDNVVSGAVARHDVESYWPAGNPVGVDNVAHDNCLWGGREGTLSNGEGGLRATSNITVNPQYAAARSHNYEMSANSPCLALVGDVQAAVNGTQPVQPAPAARDATRKALMHAARRPKRRHRHHG